MPRAKINIYEDDDFERMAEAKRAVIIATADLKAAKEEAAAAAKRFGDAEPDDVAEAKAKLQAAKDAFDECVTKAAARGETWELQHLGFESWLKLLGEHPPRKVTEGEGDEAKEVVDPEDQSWGIALEVPPFNTETFGRALLLYVDPEDPDNRTVVKLGDAEPGTVLAKRMRRLSVGQLTTLWVAAHNLNTNGVVDPKALLYSTGPSSSES